MKKCSSCKTEKTLNEFYKNSSTKDGRKSYCIECAKIKSKVYCSKPEVVSRKRTAKKLFSKTQPECLRYHEAKRRASRLKATPDWLTESQKEEIKTLYWMARDLFVVSGQEYHVDHIVPLNGRNVCGLHVPWNLQLLPADLNLTKSNS